MTKAKNKKIKFIDLFSGIGGFRLAMQKAAINSLVEPSCVAFSEIDTNAIKTYKANFQSEEKEIEIGDITFLDSTVKINKTLPNFNVLFAGFPCQPFSLMGKGMGFEDTRGTLFFHIAKLLSVKKPDFFILENVRGLATHDQGKTLERIRKILIKLGYHVRTELCNSVNFGVPQTRRRIYFIGFKDKKVFEEAKNIDLAFEETIQYPTTWHLLDRNADNKYYLSERILKTILSDGSGGYKSKSEINRIIARPLTATMHKMHRANQDNYYSDSFIKGHYTANNNSVVLKTGLPYRVRKITPVEAFRIQGFPDEFVYNAVKAGVSDTQLYRQAGNAITVNTAYTILNKIFTKTSLLKSLKK